MKPLDPRPWDSLSDEEQAELWRIQRAVDEWNRNVRTPDPDKVVKTKRGKK